MNDEAPTSSKRQPSLRERKFARTKLALLQAAMERMRHKSLSDITVKELCEEVQVSEATFFNYFPKKDDLLFYFIQLWIIEVTAHTRGKVGNSGGIRYIECIFEYTGSQLADHPRLMLELIAHMASAPRPPSCEHGWEDVSLAERRQAFPDLDGVEDVPLTDLPNVFRPALVRAVDRGELAKTLDVDSALLALLSVFFGVPLLLGHSEPERIKTAYKQHLELLWTGMQAGACCEQTGT